MIDGKQSQLDKSSAFIRSFFEKEIKKGKLTEADAQSALSRLLTSLDLGAVTDANFVVEAATEDLPLKQKIFTTLDELAKPGVILASNTSSISITKIAAATRRPADVIGMHFMNPVPVMKLVEVRCLILTIR